MGPNGRGVPCLWLGAAFTWRASCFVETGLADPYGRRRARPRCRPTTSPVSATTHNGITAQAAHAAT